jgi:putative flavoprotein involved in K+ transport
MMLTSNLSRVNPASVMSQSSSGESPLDVLVIGGGQAGLAMGHELSQRGCSFLIVDAGPKIGHVWRSRWDSLRLFTSRGYNDLPGLPFPPGEDPYPGKDEVAAYLQTYASHFNLPVRLGARVTSLTRSDGVYTAMVGEEAIEARRVVIATGPFGTPAIPSIAAQIDADVIQIHSSQYKRAAALPTGPVLVVGAANSGCQIALELSAERKVDLAVGGRLPAIPQRPLGRDVWTWATALRLDKISAQTRLGQRLSKRDQIIGPGPRQLAKAYAIGLRPRVTGAAHGAVSFADGATAKYESVVWATGFTSSNDWIHIPGLVDEQGRIRQIRGITPSPGLYTLGLPWQRTRGSALLGWVGADAAHLSRAIHAPHR